MLKTPPKTSESQSVENAIAPCAHSIAIEGGPQLIRKLLSRNFGYVVELRNDEIANLALLTQSPPVRDFLLSRM
jgi:hypothetical protein